MGTNSLAVTSRTTCDRHAPRAAAADARRSGKEKRSTVAEAPSRRSQQRRNGSDWGTLSEGLEAANAEEGETGGGERQALGGGTSRIWAPAKGSVMAARAWFPSI